MAAAATAEDEMEKGSWAASPAGATVTAAQAADMAEVMEL